MSAEHKIVIQEGPTSRAQVASTFIRAEGDGGYWVSTVPLYLSYNTKFETIVFPVPSDVELVLDEDGPDFTKSFRLVQEYGSPINSYSLTNMNSMREALRNHQEAVKAATEILAERAS